MKSRNHLVLNTISRPKIEPEMLDIIRKHFSDFPRIIFDINATNGYLSIQGFDNMDVDALPSSEFMIELPKLHKWSLGDDRGAFFFDKKCVGAIYNIADTILWDINESVSLYIKREISVDLEEVIV